MTSDWRMLPFNVALFLMCSESEASWLKKKQTVTSARRTNESRMPGEVNLSLCKQGQLPFSDKQGKERVEALPLFLPTFQNYSCKLPTVVPPHHIPLRAVVAIPGWESVTLNCSHERVSSCLQIRRWLRFARRVDLSARRCVRPLGQACVVQREHISESG